MDNKTQKVLELEETGRYESAFHTYELLDYQSCFEHWKHFYFFLWYINVEDIPLRTSELVGKYKLEKRLKEIAEIGFRQFSANAEFKFLAGYTIALFPYYYGAYEEWENKGNDLLRAAYEQDPNNLIYELAYNGSSFGSTKLYNETKLKASEVVKTKFSGIGLMNSYFSEIIGRKRI